MSVIVSAERAEVKPNGTPATMEETAQKPQKGRKKAE
jgi:hypothetical protein